MDKRHINPSIDNRLHHGQMLEIIVRLEERVAGKELNQDASNAPNVTRVRPPESEDNLGRTVVPRGHYRRMILVLEGCRAKVDQTNLRVQQNPSLCGLAADGGTGRRDLPVVRKGLIFIVTEENVFWFEVGMDQVEIVEDLSMALATKTLTGLGRRRVGFSVQATLVNS